ncbi:small EDRK-rich factor 1 isoform X1 [Peromyscus maniculatus bairdii]|uniref:small EDRK-rich factor 1 isoform X1 n=1 Tax=Peromyscus maniculatus bairdii TaxID=230844 RepID=UPI003FD1F707
MDLLGHRESHPTSHYQRSFLLQQMRTDETHSQTLLRVRDLGPLSPKRDVSTKALPSELKRIHGRGDRQKEGGNQRELARQKNMKKTQEISKGKRKEDSLTTSQRKQRDSEIMQQKQKIANEKKSMQTREK